jgi:hypothetical protein
MYGNEPISALFQGFELFLEAIKVGSGSGSSCNQDPDPHQCDADPQHCSKPLGPGRADSFAYHAPRSRKDETRKTSTSGTLFYCTEFKPVTAGYPVSSEQYPHWPYLLFLRTLIDKNVQVQYDTSSEDPR